LAVTERLNEQGDQELQRVTRMLSENREQYAGIRRRGGCDQKAIW